MSTCLIEVLNLNKRFKDVEVIKNLNLKIETGKIYFLIGENGSGKSTFLKLLVGLYKPTKGLIKRYYNDFSYVPELLIYKDKIKVNKYLNRVIKLLNIKRDFKLEEYFLIEKDKYLNKLSKGNQKKILLYLAFIKENEIVFLDEPFDGLDKEVKSRFINYLLTNNKTTYVISSHDQKILEELKEKEVINFDKIY